MKLLFLIFFLISVYHSALAQWEPMGGPYGGSVNDLVQNEFYQFASTSNGLYRSDDSGRTWSRLVIGLGPDYTASFMAIHQNQIVVYAGSPHTGEWKNYLVKSDDYGISWTVLNKPETPNYLTIAINDYGIYVADFTHLWVSTDQGLTWNISSLPRGRELSQYNDQIYIGVYKTIFRSASDADEWSEIVVDGMTSAINTFQVFDSVILVRDEYGKLLVSDDGGETWTNSVIPSYWGAQINFIKINDAFYGYRFDDILRSEDNGLTWDSIATQAGIRKMIVAGDTIIAATYSYGILRSTDLGVSFQSHNLILDAARVEAIEADQNYLWTGCSFQGVSRHEKSTNAWDTILLPATFLLQDIKSLDDMIFVVKGYDIYRSSDEGASWSIITPITNGPGFSQLYIDGQTIRAGGPSENTLRYLYKSNDYGENWQPDTFRINNVPYWPSIFTKKGSILFTADSYHIFRSMDSGLSWEILNGYTLDGWITDIKASDNLLFANQIFGDDVPEGSTSFSRDNGETWELLDIGFPAEYHEYGFQFETEVNNHLIVTGSDRGIYISRDQAISWEHFDERLSFNYINEIISDDKYLYAATSGQGVWRRKISDVHTNSIDQPVSKTEILIFPNPSNGNFRLQLDAVIESDGLLKITDIHGQTLLSKQIQILASTEFHAPDLIPGIYFVSFQTSLGNYTGKMLVQK